MYELSCSHAYATRYSYSEDVLAAAQAVQHGRCACMHACVNTCMRSRFIAKSAPPSQR